MLRVSNWPRKFAATLIIVAAIGLALGVYLALATLLTPPDINVAGFEVDGDMCVDTLPVASKGQDWATLPNKPGCPSGPDSAVFVPAAGGLSTDFTCRGQPVHQNLKPSALICDDTSQAGSTDSNILSPSGKDFDVTTWCTQSGNNPAKVDLANVMAYTAGGKMYAAMDRLSNNGAALGRFEVNQKAFTAYVPGNCPNAANTVPDRVGDGCSGPKADDLEFIYSYSGGGRVVDITINHWKTTGTSPPDASGHTVPLGVFESCGETAQGRVNDGTDKPSTGNIIVPPYLPTITCSTSQTGGNSCRLVPSGSDDRIGPRTLMEGAVSIPGGTCGGWIHAESITSSGAVNPDLKDVAGPSPFSLCGIEVTKTPDRTDVCTQNAEIEYTYTVHNSGVVALTVTVVDDNGTPGDPSDDIDLTPLFKAANSGSDILPPDATVTFKKTTTLTATTTNTVTATGWLGGTPVSATAKATVNVHTCSISLTKTPDIKDVCNGAGTQVKYTYVVKNTGDFFNVSGTLVDDNGTPANPADDINVDGWGPLAPGASATLTNTRAINATTTNIATASGTFTDASSTKVTATATATVNGYTCEIDVSKACEDAAGGSPIPFSGTVSNKGSAELKNVSLVDDNGTPADPSDDVTIISGLTLAPAGSPGDSVDYSGSYFPTQSPSTNTVTATGDAFVPAGASLGITVIDSASATCEVVGCALSPGFWKGGEGVHKWDQLTGDPATSDPIAWAAGFATFTRFPWLAAWLDNSSYLDVLNLPTRSDVTIQLGFKYIAATLNQAAFGVPTSTAALLLEIEDYFALNPVGSNPKGPAKTEGQRLLGLLNNYFSTVGEAYCPNTGDVPELR